jgi:hypothetical protein
MYNEKQTIKDTLERLQSHFDMAWEFSKAELTNGELFLTDNQGMKFKITMEYVGFTKGDPERNRKNKGRNRQ